MTSDPAKQAWQASVEIGGALPIEDVRKGATRFYRTIWWRNLVEYAACVVVVIGFSINLFTLPHLLQKLGSVAIIAGTLYVAWQLHRRASAVPPEAAGAMPLLQFSRAQLARQRDALRSVFGWYIAPFLPGMLLVLAGSMLHKQAKGDGPGAADAVGTAVIVALMAGIWGINQLAARKLQRHIDEIDALTGGSR